MNRIILYLLLAVAATGCFQNEGELSGVISDTDGTPIPGTEVSIDLARYPNDILKTTADSGGRYSFSGVPAGWYSVTASSGDYAVTTGFKVMETSFLTCGPLHVNGDISIERPLLAHYPLDEGSGTALYDSSKYANTGSAYNTSWNSGQSGYALGFNGVDSYALLNGIDKTKMKGHHTIALWCRPYGFPTFYGNSYAYMVSCPPPDGDLQLADFGIGVNWSGAIVVLVGSCIVQTSLTVPTGSWTHIAYSYDGSALKAYVNGSPSFGCGMPNQVKASTFPVVMGGSKNGTAYGYPFYGDIDDVRIFDKVLSDDEIAALAQ